ncbi:MAG TPA: MFS transporter [Candidatus Lokiarchaeia archaeon]|nr:MFS transporter [Candidatus Lokiarchaeia archaeon]
MTTQENEVSPPTFWTKHRLTVYAMPRFGAALVANLQGFVITFLYAEIYNLSGILTGISTGLGFLVIAASQFLMGWVSDRTNTRWGRRRPFVLFGTPILAASFFLLFTAPLFLGNAPDQLSLFAWLILWNSVYEFAYGVTTTPYQAMLAEITQVAERPRASQLQNYFSYVGVGAASALTILGISKITEEISASTLSITSAPFLLLVLIFLICAAVMAISFFLFASIMPKEKPKSGAREPLWANLKEILKNRNLLRLTLFQGIANFTWSMFFTLILGFMELVLHLMDTFFIIGPVEIPVYYVVAVALIVGILCFLTIWRKIIEKHGKKFTLQVILLLGICVYPLSLIGIIQGVNMGIAGMILMVLVTAPVGGFFLFPYILYADFAEDDVRRTNNFKAGLYAGFPEILVNVFQALSMFVTGVLIDKTIMPILPGTTVTWGYVLWGPIGAVFLLIAFVFLRKYIVLDFAWEKSETDQGE